MKIAHIGPPLERTGGPAGYLLELCRAAESFPSSEHEVVFPARSSGRPAPPVVASSSILDVVKRWKRAVVGPPSFYRPTDDEIRQSDGPIARLLRDSAQSAAAQCEGSLADAASGQPDVLFIHEGFAASRALELRRDAEVWLFVHAPMPAALYLAWCWGRPDLSWEDVAALPDVRRGVEDELRLWREVDRVVLPCPEARDELARIDSRFGEIDTPVEHVLTGSSVGGSLAEPTERRGDILGLFLGNAQPYRGLDVLLEAVARLPERAPGKLLVAGPDKSSLPAHPRLRALGRVRDVAALLESVDFVVNTNRFSLFDLSNIEATAAGKALLLHSVGGNRALEKLGAGCRSFDELAPQPLSRELAAMFATPRSELEALGARSRECYERHLTAAKMWDRHVALYDTAAARIGPEAAARS